MPNLDIYQKFLSNLIFVGLVLTMTFYWAGLIFSKNNYIVKLAYILGEVCSITLIIYLTWRWYNYNFFPLSNLYESLMFLTCLLLVLYKIFEVKTKSRIIGCLIIPLVVLIQGFACLSLPIALQKSSPLVPSLQSNWLMFHVSMMMLSYAMLLFGSLFSLLYIIVNENKNNKVSDNYNLQKNLDKIKLLELLDNWSYRIIGLGFPFLTMGILSGSVWANEAWGSYWSWDPKETWALITWFIFAIYLHTRLIKNITGKKAAFVGSLGFFVVWVCYLGVNFLGKGLHSYGWLN